MEGSDDGDGRTPEGWKNPPEAAGEKPAKRKMKSPFQLEILERTYSVSTYPSEAIRAELSAKIGLTDRQLQMWFCHRRLKDRKPPSKRQRRDDGEEHPTPPPAGEMAAAPGSMGSSSSPFSGDPRKAAPSMPRTGAEAKRYYEPPVMLTPTPPMAPQLSMAGLRVIAFVEAQLGEQLRDDGPVLGIEFDPLPPGAFGAPIAMTGQQKQPVRPYDGKIFDRHEAKSFKASAFLPSMEHPFIPSSSSGKRRPTVGGSLVVHPQVGSRAPHEYQFLPQQPSIRSETYERIPQSHFYDSSVVAPSSRVSSLPSGGAFLHGNEQVAPSYTFQGQMSSASLLPQQSRQQMVPSGSAEYDGAPHSNSLTNTAKDSQLVIHQTIGSENPFLSPDKIYHDEDPSRTDRKRKHAQIEESRIAKGDTNEKRIKKELEKQENLKRKNEERMQKAKERHDRERKKEEERMEREKQREKYRVEREQKREIERIEKLRQKNMQRAEKTRQKEESKKEKEAARAKAANEKATAKRIAKESSELIEDERLELMELAASSKGLSSIISLDSETLEQLDLFRGMLSTFPPKSVRLARPFAIQPWKDSEENIGNLLMVWKFLITFADILGLWPFTLDEFVQSLHDYDSRLLGEIHVVLLKSIIKDIEDVARTPAIALGTNQASAVNPGGGHPQIVEGAYAWGFDICSWQRHLNPLTWPEVLRQFALSAGFGPQLKKRNIEHTYFRDDNEGDDGEDVISTLRNGAAAENAVALMHEKGYSHRRRSRHRLTPGTVKFAAFHVLSFEGSRGLTILEVAEKIQKSGLRDLTTSKTPEASIAAALSRDTKLFERTAPSTYCLRPAFRKDPADADAILSAAREKVQIFANALSDSEEAEKDVEDADDAERDDDSECDVADDPEVDDLGIQKLTKNSSHLIELKDGRASSSLDNDNSGILCNKVCPLPQTGLGNVEKGFPQSLDVGFNCHEASNTDIEGTEIDESNLGEPWVQGLTEGEYSDLSVEERLSALVSLIGVAIEGNSIRVILEERLEAATALKKQIWAEGQLDKRRWKEDYAGKMPYSSFVGYKAEATQTNAAAGESPTPLQLAENKDNDGNLTPLDSDQVPCPQSLGSIKNSMSIERNLSGQEFSVNPDTVPLQHGIAAEKSRSQLKSYIGHKAEELYVYRSLPLGQDRRRNRYWLFSTSASRNDPGSGRIFFESREGFWRLIDSEEAFDALIAALDTRGVRESHLHSMLQRIETTFKETCRKRKFTNPVNPSESLNKAGATEMTSSPDCSTEFDSPSSTLCGLTLDTSQYSPSFNIELGRNELERNSALKRYNVLLKWMWKGCYNPLILCAMKYGKKRCPELLQTCNLCYQSYFAEEMHCPSCHKTFKSFYNAETIFLEHVAQCKERRKIDPDWKIQVSDAPIAIQFLKAQFSLIEASIPADALQPFWTDGYRKSWGVKLQSSSSAEDLLQILTLLEDAVKRDCFSSNFETTNQLLSSTTRSGVGNSASSSGSVPVLPWVPDTTAAVALRLLDLDASISYMKVEPHKERESGEFIKLPSRYAVVKNFQEEEATETPEQTDFLERKWIDPVSSGRRGRGRGSRGGRGGRGRGRGGRVGRPRVMGRSSEFGEGSSSINYEKSTRKYTRRGRGRGRGGRKRGRRSVRPHQMLDSRVVVVDKPAFQFGGYNFGTSTTTSAKPDSSSRSSGDEWGHLEENSRLHFIGEEDDNSVGFQSDENGQASADEYDEVPREPDYRRVYHESQPIGRMNDDTEEEEEEEEDDDDDDEEVQGNGHDIDVEDDDEYEEIGDEDGGIGGNEDEDEVASFYSSEFSD